MNNNEAYSDDDRSYRLRDFITGLVTVGPQILLILLLLLGGARIRESLAGLGRTAAAAAPEVVQPTAEPVVEAAQEVAQAESPTPAPTPIPTPDVPEMMPVIDPPSVDVAGALSPSELFLVPAGIAAGWVAEQMPGIALDPNSPGGLSGLPPHLQALFQGTDAAATGSSGFGIDPNKPQLNVIPLAALQGMYNEAGLGDAAASLDGLKDLLANRPEGSTDIPYPPVFGGPPQGIQSDPTYIDFNGGSGVGYVTHFSFDAGPITNENGLAYVFQGVTADGSQYIVGTFPLQADFLPDSLNDIPQETLNEIVTDPAPYLASVVEQINGADDASISPAPSMLAAMLSGMIIGPDAVAAHDAATMTDLAAAPPMTNVLWQWTAFADQVGNDNLKIDNPENYTLVLNADGTYNMKADCNVVNGSYSFAGGTTLTLNPGASTLVACGPDSFEATYRQYMIGQPLGYAFNADGNLILTLPDGSGKLTFINGSDAAAGQVDPMVNVLYQWAAFQDLDGSDNLKIDNPENYLFALNPDGTYTIKADCNIINGTYGFENGKLVLQPGASTKADCGPDSFSDQYLGYFAEPLDYSFDVDGNLQLGLPDGSGELAFVDAGPAGPGPSGSVVIPSIEGTTFQWGAFVDLDGSDNIKVDNPEDYTVTLNPDGTYSIKADCNTVVGAYAFEDGKLVLQPGASTLAACGPDSLDAEFLDLIFQSLDYSFGPDGNLQLALPDGSGELSLSADAAAGQVDPMVNVLYQWAAFQDLDGSDNLKIDNPENYSFALNPDGTYTIKADCNIINGTYGFENGKLVLQPGASTKADCGPDSFSDQYLGYFAEPLDYSFDVDGNLQLGLPDGSGELAFVDAGPAGPGPSGSVVIPSIEGTTFQWGAFVDLDGSDNIKVDNPEDYTVTLNPDGTYSIKADCNTVVGAYTFENGKLVLQPGASTLAACGPDSLDAEFLALVFQPLDYSFSPDANLVLSLPDGSGELSLSTDAAGRDSDTSGTTESTTPATGTSSGTGGATSGTTDASGTAATGGTTDTSGTTSGTATGGATQTTPSGTSQPAPAIAGTSWQWVSFVDAKQSFSLADPTLYTVTFNADGSLAAKLDCNSGTGTWTATGSSLTIDVRATTRVACAEGSLGNSFANRLNAAAIFVVEGTVLRIDLFADSGTMTLSQIQ